MRGVTIGKRAQAAILLGYTTLLLAVTLLVEGVPGVRTNLDPFDDVRRLTTMARRGSVLSSRFLYALLGIAANLALFFPWGFLAHKLLRERGRGPLRTHVHVVALGGLLSVSIETIQLFLPTRAADVNDIFWNVLGTAAGSLAAHAHGSVTVEWE